MNKVGEFELIAELTKASFALLSLCTEIRKCHYVRINPSILSRLDCTSAKNRRYGKYAQISIPLKVDGYVCKGILFECHDAELSHLLLAFGLFFLQIMGMIQIAGSNMYGCAYPMGL